MTCSKSSHGMAGCNGRCMYLCVGFSLMSFPLFVVAFLCFLNGHETSNQVYLKEKKNLICTSFFLLLMMMLLLFRTKYYHDCFGLHEALNDSIHLSVNLVPMSANRVITCISSFFLTISFSMLQVLKRQQAGESITLKKQRSRSSPPATAANAGTV